MTKKTAILAPFGHSRSNLRSLNPILSHGKSNFFPWKGSTLSEPRAPTPLGFLAVISLTGEFNASLNLNDDADSDFDEDLMNRR